MNPYQIKNSIMQYFKRIFNPGSSYHPDTMIHALYWIAGVSISVILSLATGTVYVITSNEIEKDAMKTAVMVTNSMFDQYSKLLIKSSGDDKYYLELNQSDLPEIDALFRSYLRNYEILKVKIYIPSKMILYSSDQKIIGNKDINNKRLQRSLVGEVDSHIEKKDRMLDLADETKFNISVVETYVPIWFKNKVIGSMELYTNVTPYFRGIINNVAMTLISLAAILLFVFGCSNVVIRKVIRLLSDTQQELANKVQQLEEALSKVRQLEGIIPICSYCKKIRDDGKSWHQMENYISNHSEAKFSHGVCPECYELQMLEIKAMCH